jgi:hypothetical protein
MLLTYNFNFINELVGIDFKISRKTLQENM